MKSANIGTQDSAGLIKAVFNIIDVMCNKAESGGGEGTDEGKY
jgi:hypothetical protein